MASNLTRLLALLLVLPIAGCGIKGDLVKPKDIPQYEKEKAAKRDRAL